MRISFRIITEMNELASASELVKNIWGKENAITPYLLRAQVHVGGLVIGAYEDDLLIGVSYGFPGVQSDGEVFFYSHILGVKNTYRGKNVGGMLKRFQAEAALEKGYKKMKWTFDPLQTRNANLNIRKLGATSNTYLPDFYGKMTDALNVGMPSDRLLVEWDLQKMHQERKFIALKCYAYIMKVDMGAEPEFPVTDGWKESESDFLCIAVPTQFQEIKKVSAEMAKDWRLQTRDAFQFYFKRGYSIIDFNFQPDRNVQCYLLHKR